MRHPISLLRCLTVIGFALVAVNGCSIEAPDPPQSSPEVVVTDAPGNVMRLVQGSMLEQQSALAWLRDHWQHSYIPMLLEAMPAIYSAPLRQDVFVLLETETGADLPRDLDAWFRWLWMQPYEPHDGYAWFKSVLYGRIDDRFRSYFKPPVNAAIRLDEIRWGGVKQNGIPPLRKPRMIDAQSAEYLDDSNIVFGIVVNGDARAYPKRILAHHEMVLDDIGGVDMAGVYCTLCGAMIAYETAGYDLGTSGFLYRSNKLMFDEKSSSLWSTFTGHPVVGELASEDIFLERHPVVTTTWGDWRNRHPDSSVPSLATGYRRDYDEGAAYREYFATDALMFTVPADERGEKLGNKDEVLALRSGDEQLAIDAELLASKPVFHGKLAGKDFVVITNATGANRVYASSGHRFSTVNAEGTQAIDQDQDVWQITEDALLGPNDESLPRLPAHRAFWFGWLAAFPDTRLIID